MTAFCKATPKRNTQAHNSEVATTVPSLFRFFGPRLHLGPVVFAIWPRTSTFKTMRPRLLVSTIIAFTALASAQAEDPQMLRIHWEPGKTYTLETVTDTTSQTPGRDLQTQGMKVVQTTTLTVRKDTRTTDRLVEVKFVNVQGEISSGGRILSFDSTHPKDADPRLQQAFGRAIGKSFVLVYDDQDRYRDTRDFGSLASAPGALTGLTALADSRNVANLFRKSLEMGLPPLAVSLGDTWTADETMTFPQAGDTHVEINGKFEAVQDRDGRKHAKIAFEGKLTSVEKIDKPINAIEIGKGSAMAGSIYYDLERRTATFGDYVTKLKLEVVGQEMPFEQHITTKVLSIEDSK